MIDWYGLGAIVYEFLVSVPPYLNTMDEQKLYDNILNQPLLIPTENLSEECQDFLKQILNKNMNKRLGF